MPTQIKVSDSWKTVNAAGDCYIKVDGAWKKCEQVYVKVDGAWKPCFSTYTTKTVSNAIGIGRTVTLNNVQIGSTVSISGTINSPLAWDQQNVPGSLAGTSGRPYFVFSAEFSLTGATLSSSSGNGSIGGTFVHYNMGGEVNNYASYSYGIPAPSLTFGPQGGNYTLNIKATSSTVKISVRLRRYNDASHIDKSSEFSINGNVVYVGS